MNQQSCIPIKLYLQILKFKFLYFSHVLKCYFSLTCFFKPFEVEAILGAGAMVSWPLLEQRFVDVSLATVHQPQLTSRWGPLLSVLQQILSRGKDPCGSVVKNPPANGGDFKHWVGKMPWRRKWQPTPIFLPGKSCGQRSLAGYRPWGCRRVRHNLATKQQQESVFTVIKINYKKYEVLQKLL